LISTGHALTELLMVGALALGMGQALRYPLLVAGIGILGGLFLLWMGGSLGWGALQRKLTLPRPDRDKHPKSVEGCGAAKPATLRQAQGGSYNLIGLGIATTVSNPFWYLWWIGVGGGYVLAALSAFYLGHVAADYAWNTLLASAVDSGRRRLSDRVYRALLVACGLFLVYTGLRFVWAGIEMVQVQVLAVVGHVINVTASAGVTLVA
jgi:threonine/homoserine/homoserine lactone efflux protein